MQLWQKVIVITGGASGIGRATALYCAQQGAVVAVGDVKKGEGQETVEQIHRAGGIGYFFPVDVCREEEVAGFMAFAEQNTGRIDVLISAAGILRGYLVPLEDFEQAAWDAVMDVNLKGSFLAVKHVVPAMKRAGRGVVLLIASGAGVRGGSGSVAYGSSKGGVHGLALTLEAHLAPHNIRVHAVCPGNINTPLKLGAIQEFYRVGKADEAERQMAQLGSPEGVAKVLAFLASDDADYVRGTVFTR